LPSQNQRIANEQFVLTTEHVSVTAVQITEWRLDSRRKNEPTQEALWLSTTATQRRTPDASISRKSNEGTPMSLIKEYYEAEIQQNAANNPNRIPSGTQATAIAFDLDLASYFNWMDEEIESLVKSIGHK
jgi:hypothetical protein